ncbi:MAG: alginate export family protein [Steroidobacteraceae bacterium]
MPSQVGIEWSGELRERWEVNDAAGFGLGDVGNDDYLLHRVRLGADWHLSSSFRLVGELISGSASGWGNPASAVQSDSADLLQGYAAIGIPLAEGRAELRLGRQEISLGSSRLVSVRESPNVRRAFDGVRMSWSGAADAHAELFLVRPVQPEKGAFDDGTTAGQSFWGLDLAVAPAWLPQNLKVETYYLGYRRAAGRFGGDTAVEKRHSAGARLYGETGANDWNMEAVWQWGTFGATSIRAWTLSADMGITLTQAPMSPRLGLKADAISGDEDPHDARLQTFNPLFPKLPYFSEANLASPANLLDIQPSARLRLSGALTATLSWNALWKFAREDAFYVPALDAQPGTANNEARYIGQQYGIAAEWQVTQPLQAAATIVHFEPGRLIRDAGGRSGNFAAVSLQYQF